MKKYKHYSREQLIYKIEFLRIENKCLKAWLRESKEFKDFKRAIEENFGGEE